MAKGMGGNMGNMMKQVAKMQRKMEEMQAELADKQVEGTAGGGMVKVTATGAQEIIAIKIEKEVVNPDDVEMLEDLILSAVNQAKEKAAELQSELMGSVTGGLNIPGMPF
ncbi:MAG: YbaB/EbfC family nucleoid-associated protein [candidate division Zixibacteria bacterium]|nr:YbaB/EbfC family nucleoid-associated protein [candidate division Zixibacteria bacterium]